MSDVSPQAPAGVAPAPSAAPAPVAPAPVAPPAPAAEATPASSPWDDPATAKSEIERLRRENASERTNAKTAAADAARQEYADKIAVALGLKPDAAADPAALTASLTEAQTKAQSAARELAIFKAAASTGADPTKLLDSNSFLSSVTGLDPADGAAITAAITAAIAANPQLKAVQAAAASGTELGGSGEQGQISEAQLAHMTPEQIVEAQSKGLLRTLLGG